MGAGAFHDFPRIDIKTTYGQASLYGRDHIWESLTWATRDELAAYQMTAPPEALGNTRYTYAMQHFIDCIRSDSPPLSSIDDGVKTVAMAMAVYEAASTGIKITLKW
jgi:predicted dehydrogenase